MRQIPAHVVVWVLSHKKTIYSFLRLSLKTENSEGWEFESLVGQRTFY